MGPAAGSVSAVSLRSPARGAPPLPCAQSGNSKHEAPSSAACISHAAVHVRLQVVATNARKLLTVALSFILFPKGFSASFALSGLAVVAGVGVHSYSRRVARAATTSAVKKAD